VRLAFILTEVGYGVHGIIQDMRLLHKDRLFDTQHINKQTNTFQYNT
jgi:hypothetical protein